MSLARGANYSQAGIHTTLNDPFDVRDTVRITDATAGARRPIYEGTDSDEHLKQRNWQPGFTILQAGLFLLAVVLVLGSVYLVRRNQVTALAIEVNRMNDSIYSLMADGKTKFPDGEDRMQSRVLADYVQTEVVRAIRTNYD